MGKNNVNEIIQAKLYRLEELRKYQAHYGPNTPYAIIVEINNLETEIHRALKAGQTRRTHAVKKAKKRQNVPLWQFWRMSQATTDLIATIAFIGLVFLLGSIVFATYMHTRPSQAAGAVAFNDGVNPQPTLRPTFTPTPNPDDPGSKETADAPIEAAAVIAPESAGLLPTPGSNPTDVPTLVPTLTATAVPPATETPPPTDTPLPTVAPPPRPTATSAPPTPTPAPSFPFSVAEQGNRVFQKTNYHAITVYVAVVSEGNIPVGGFKVIGDHVPTGQHVESGISTWNWDVANCKDCDYVKFGNIKFEPGPFMDGIWNIYLVDSAGSPVSPVVSLTYSADPTQWVWDFVLFRRISG
jgi:hypothetical protein